VGDATIADEESSLRDRDDVAEGCHSVLQGSMNARHRCHYRLWEGTHIVGSLSWLPKIDACRAKGSSSAIS
jgi:hypothetical protein